MRRTTLALVVSAVALGGCAETMEKRMGDVRSLVEQGKAAKKEAIEGMANQVPGYCSSDITQAAATYIRGEVNAVLAVRKQKYRIGKLCVLVDPETGEPVK